MRGERKKQIHRKVFGYMSVGGDLRVYEIYSIKFGMSFSALDFGTGFRQTHQSALNMALCRYSGTLGCLCPWVVRQALLLQQASHYRTINIL